MIVAIDGPAGAGKSTVARGCAEALGFTYLDTGAMYRCVALARLRDPACDAGALEIELGDRVMLDGEDVTGEIREARVTEEASRVAADPEVRTVMAERQRALLASGDWVAEGRDIGTVIAPDAELKVFLTADPRERARRRAEQTGRPAEEVFAEQSERDARDGGRRHSPLRAADDAVALDTSGLSVTEVCDRVVAMVAERRGAGGDR